MELRRLFEDYQKELEEREELLAVRLIEPAGGLFWRNRAAREFYERRGFFSSPTVPWAGMLQWLTAAELRVMAECFREAFETGQPVEWLHQSQAAGHEVSVTRVRLLAVAGTLQHGITINHLTPCDASGAGLSELPRRAARERSASA
jgi:dihydroorotase-like cyclic amidohydrolase